MTAVKDEIILCVGEKDVEESEEGQDHQHSCLVNHNSQNLRVSWAIEPGQTTWVKG